MGGGRRRQRGITGNNTIKSELFFKNVNFLKAFRNENTARKSPKVKGKQRPRLISRH